MTLVTIVLLVALSQWALVTGQSLPQLNFHFATPEYPGRIPETLDVHIDEDLDHLLEGLMCRYEGNRFTVRISPSEGATKLIDDSLGTTNLTPGAINCMVGKTPQRVKCVDPSFCTLGNICTANIKAVCSKYKTFNRWMMTQNVDVTLDRDSQGKITVVKCYTLCETELTIEPEFPSRSGGLSYLAISLIVVGVMLAAILFVVLIIVFKVRTGHLLSMERKRSVTIEYVK